MTLYQKVIAVVAMLRDSIRQRATKTELAPAFSESTLYRMGRLVIHDGGLYKCTVDHSGPWNADHFQSTTIDAALAAKSDGGGGGGGGSTGGTLYVKDGEGLLHEVTIGKSGDIYILEVDQEGKSEV